MQEAQHQNNSNSFATRMSPNQDSRRWLENGGHGRLAGRQRKFSKNNEKYNFTINLFASDRNS